MTLSKPIFKKYFTVFMTTQGRKGFNTFWTYKNAPVLTQKEKKYSRFDPKQYRANGIGYDESYTYLKAHGAKCITR